MIIKVSLLVIFFSIMLGVGLYCRKHSTDVRGFVLGAGIMVLNMLTRPSFPTILQSPINCGVIAMLGGLIIVPIVSFITKKPEKSETDEMFSCYNRDVVVKSKESLGK